MPMPPGKSLIKLVIQSYDYAFLPKGTFHYWDSNLLYRDLGPGPIKKKEINNSDAFIYRPLQKTKKVKQEILVYHINKDCLYWDEKNLQKWKLQLYTRIPLSEKNEDLSRFIRETGFCDFIDVAGQPKEKQPLLGLLVSMCGPDGIRTRDLSRDRRAL